MFSWLWRKRLLPKDQTIVIEETNTIYRIKWDIVEKVWCIRIIRNGKPDEGIFKIADDDTLIKLYPVVKKWLKIYHFEKQLNELLNNGK